MHQISISKSCPFCSSYASSIRHYSVFVYILINKYIYCLLFKLSFPPSSVTRHTIRVRRHNSLCDARKTYITCYAMRIRRYNSPRDARKTRITCYAMRIRRHNPLRDARKNTHNILRAARKPAKLATQCAQNAQSHFSLLASGFSRQNRALTVSPAWILISFSPAWTPAPGKCPGPRQSVTVSDCGNSAG